MPDSSPVKVLMVCDQFPPGFGPRMGYLCKYLSQSGIVVDVVCESPTDRRYEVLTGYARHVESVSYYKYESGFKHNIEWGLTMVLNALFAYKDRRLVRAVKHRREMRGYDLVLCSTYKTFPLKAGLSLARYFKVPLVADLRDLVEQYSDKSYLARRLGGGRFGSAIEDIITRQSVRQRNRVLRRAAALTTVSPWHVEFLKRLNPHTELIYNGYDPELFYPAPCVAEDGVFRITFTGRLISLENRNPELLFEALANLNRQGLIRPESIQVEWFVDEYSRALVEEMAARYGVGTFMAYKGFVPAAEVPKVLNQSSILLQLANKAGGADADGSGQNGPKGIMTTKIFEALAVGKPMLLVRSDESYLADLLERYRCGLAAVNAKQVEDFILEWLAVFREKGCTSIAIDPGIERLYSRKSQAGQFKALFHKVERTLVRKSSTDFSPYKSNTDFSPYNNQTTNKIPLFLQSWWWQAVSNPSSTETLEIRENGELKARWPLHRLLRLKVFPVWANPPLTQHNGPWLSDRKYFKDLLLQISTKANLCVSVGFELNEEEEALCRQLGIRTKKRTTHRLVHNGDIEQVFKGIEPAQQRQIKKGMKYLHRVQDPDIEDLIRLLQGTFRRRGLKTPYKADTVRSLYRAVKEHDAGELIALADAGNRIVAAGLFVHDNRFLYSLCHGYEKTDKNVGAGSLLQWEGIKTACEKKLIFDFEGSSIESIARFNLSFGSQPYTYTCLERYRAPLRVLLK